MGALAGAVRRLQAFLPELKTNVGMQIPTWETNNPQYPRYWHNYWRFALEGYGRNEIVYAAVEELATSAAEPRLMAYRKGANGKPEALGDHPILDLFEHPNPFMSRYALIANLIMFRAIAGSSYLLKTRSASGKIVQLWPLRPDRMFVIPHPDQYIRGWEYRMEDMPPLFIPREDVIQFRYRNPVDDWYGLPPLAVCAERVDTDAMMRSFTLAFFRNAAVPAGLLNITKQVTTAERQLIRDKFRGETGGPQNWHQMLVLDNMEAKYQPMGLPLGQAGIVLPELDEISEARIGMAFGVPLELLGARLGMVHGNRSTMDAARSTMWDETLVPLYHEMAADMTRSFVDEPWDEPFDYLEFDLSTVQALQEDADAKHIRIRADVEAGILSVQEARKELGYEPDYDPDALLMLGPRIQPMQASQAEAGTPQFEPKEPAPTDESPPPPPRTNGNGNGNGHRRLTAEDLRHFAALAAGAD
jgi:HK97 family phage portal protein